MLALAANRPLVRLFVRRWGLSLVLILASLSALAGELAPAPIPVARLEQEISFHIRTGSLESALIEFSRQTELQVVVAAPVTRVTVPELNGRFAAGKALLRLLQGTGLVYTVVGNTVTVQMPVVTSNNKHTATR
jgi:Secretin and TonB N terminus short domain